MGDLPDFCGNVRRFDGERGAGDACLAGANGHDGQCVFSARKCVVAWRNGTSCFLRFAHSAPHQPPRDGWIWCGKCEGLGHLVSQLTGAQRCDGCRGWGIVMGETKTS